MLIQLNLKKWETLNIALKKYFKKTNQNIFGQTRNQLFSVKKCKSFLRAITLKFIIPTVF